jgi:hypothetical protein
MPLAHAQVLHEPGFACDLRGIDSQFRGAGNRPETIRAAVDLAARLIGSGVPTLVACGAGMSRSPNIVAMALARIDGTTMEEALEEITAGVAHDASTSLWAEVRAVWEASCEKPAAPANEKAGRHGKARQSSIRSTLIAAYPLGSSPFRGK